MSAFSFDDKSNAWESTVWTTTVHHITIPRHSPAATFAVPRYQHKLTWQILTSTYGDKMHYQVPPQSEALGDDVFRLFFCLTVRLFVCLLPETLPLPPGVSQSQMLPQPWKTLPSWQTFLPPREIYACGGGLLFLKRTTLVFLSKNAKCFEPMVADSTTLRLGLRTNCTNVT